MAWKSRLTALLTGDYRELAERYLREGQRDKALEAYLKAGDWRQAGRMALELGDSARAVRILVEGALGAAGGPYLDAAPAQAAELLASAGHLEEALLLFDAGGAFRQAGAFALKLRQPARAAGYFERARDFERAAVHYEEAGRLPDALRAIEAEASRLSQAARRSQGTTAGQEARRAVEVRRSEILTRLGRKGEAMKILRAWALPSQLARHLEAAGSFREAAEAYIEADEPQEALRLVSRASGLAPRTVAQLYVRAGQPAQAAPILAGLGAVREAADAWEAAGEWEKAAFQWQGMREYVRAAQAFRRAGRLQEAGRAFELAGDGVRAAEAFALTGDHQAAGTSLLRAGRFLDASRHFLEAGSRASAARALEQVAAGSAEHGEATLRLVPLLIEENMGEAALERLRRLPAAEGASGGGPAAERLYWEGRTLESLGREEQALTCYQNLLALRRDYRDAVRRAGDLTQRREDQRTADPEPQALAPSLTPGTLLAGRYEILGELGRGGMGRVYKASDRELNEVVAIKTLLRPELESVGEDEERLVREVQICRRITHPNVLRVYDLGRVPGGIFITMEYLEGQRLDALIAGHQQLPLAQARDILSQMAAGLREAHDLGVVHRDLKPGNIMLTPRYLKILDFGIARMSDFEGRLTRTGVAIGSPLYMSPEQIEGEDLDGRSDLYSLGVLAYALLTGREPFEGRSTAAVVFAQLYSAPPDLRRFRPDLPDPWRYFVEKLLAKKPAERYASAGEVLEVLAGLPA